MHPAERTVAAHDIKHYTSVMVTNSLGILAQSDRKRPTLYGGRRIGPPVFGLPI